MTRVKMNRKIGFSSVGGISALLLSGGVLLAQGSCNATSFNNNDGGSDMSVFMGPYSDLPQDAVGAGNIQPGMVASLASAFASATANPSGGPCVSEPTLGALYPKNFTPPLFEWTAGANQNIFELRLHLDNQVNDLVVYTDAAAYTLPDALWSALTAHSSDHDITLTVRGGQLTGGQLTGGAFLGSSGNIHIAPVDAQGAIVYWTTSNGSALKGFRIGDKQVQTVLTPASITSAGKSTVCVGCHVSSPDGALAFFGRSDPRFSVDARLVSGSSGPPPVTQVTANALANLARTNQDLPTMSKAHYGSSDAVVVTIMNGPGTNGRWELIWTDLLATTGGTGIIARTGDPNQAAVPSWSHNGDTLIYTSSNAIVDGRVDTGNGDLYTVPYNNRSGGTATSLPGVNSDPKYNQDLIVA